MPKYPIHKCLEIRNFFDEMKNDRVYFTIHEGFHEPWKYGIVVQLQFATPSSKKGINVLVSVPDYKEVDVYLTKNAFVYHQRVKSKTPLVLVVP